MTESSTDLQPAVTRSRRTRKWAVLVLVTLSILAVLGFDFVRLVQDAREAARDAQCRGHFKQLAMALLEYHETFKCFPPAYTTDSDGKPMHSWRVLILPWLDNAEVSSHYDFSKPWNDPSNLKLAGKINLDLFHCPSESDHGRSLMTNYVVVVGDQSAFPGHRSTTLTEMTDGAENTIFLAEIANSDIHWMEPRDLEIAKMSFMVNDPHQASISSHHSCGPGVCFAEGRVIRLAQSLRPVTLQTLITISGREPVLKQSLILPRKDGSCLQLGEAPTLSGK